MNRANEVIRIEHAFSAMAAFLHNYWERGGRQSEELADLLGGLAGQNDGRPLDRAHWEDFLTAIDQIKAKTQ